MRKIISVWITTIFVLSTFVSNAQIIYVSADGSSNFGNIYRIDMATCTNTLVAATGISWGDLALCSGDPNILYAPDPNGNLYQIDITTGIQTLLNSQFGTLWPGRDLYALTCDGNGTLYGASDGVAGLYSYTISTNTWTNLSNLNGYLAGGDLTFLNGVLYMSTASNQLITIDISNNYTTTLIGNLSVANMYGILTIANGLACNPTSYTMLGLATSSIYTVDATSGNATILCSNIVPGEEIEGAASVSEGLAIPKINLTKTAINITCHGACDGQTIVVPINGTAPYTYSWSGGCTSATCTNLCPGSYAVVVTDSSGCTGSDTIKIIEPLVLTAATTVTSPSCNGLCDGTAVITASGGTTPYTYSWNTSPIQITATATGLCAGNYTCAVTDSNNCTATLVVTISPTPPVVIAPIPNLSICIGSSASISASASGGNPGGYNYSWDAPGTPGFATTATITVSPVSTTTYTVNATDIAHNCPAVPVSVTVTINSLPTANAGSTQYVCPGSSITLAGSIGGAATSGKWSGGTGTYLPNDSTLNAVYTPSTAEYEADSVLLTLTTNDPPGTCMPSSSTVIFRFYEKPIINFTADNLVGCPVLCTNFTDSSFIGGGDTLIAWNWNFGDSTLSSGSHNPSHCFSTTGFYNITLTAISNHGCSSSLTKTHFIEVSTVPIGAFYPYPNPATILDPTITMINQSSSDVNYWHWNFGDSDTLVPDISSPVHTFPNTSPNNYEVILIVHNAAGCYDTVKHEITIGPEFAFYIPNFFSPNGDGINDYFFGAGVGIIKYDLWIFDRWGNKIFHGEDLNSKWNGKANGGQDIAQMDVYVWKVTLIDVFNKTHDYIGTVTLTK